MLKEQLRIAKSELKDLETFLPDIDITIDINAKNPYATLRSELEHANDIAHNKVPKDENHFSRYQGRNEGEVAQGFVKHKADRKKEILSGGDDGVKPLDSVEPLDVKPLDTVKPVRTDKELEETLKDYKFDFLTAYQQKQKEGFIDNIDDGYFPDEEYSDTIFMKNKKGVTVAHASLDFEGDTVVPHIWNNGIEKGAARKIFAYLMISNPNKKIKWIAKNENSVKSYQHFCEEYPELAQRLEFENKTKIDIDNSTSYNTEKGVVNERGLELSRIEDERRGDKGSNGTFTEDESNSRISGVESNDEGAKSKTTSTSVRPEQLKLDLDFSTITPQQAAEAVVNGKSADVGDIAAMVENIIKNDKTLSSFKWKDIADNADMKEQLVKMLSDKNISPELSKAYLKGDVETVADIMSKQLAANKAISLLYDQLQDLGLNATKEQRKAIISFAGVKR